MPRLDRDTAAAEADPALEAFFAPPPPPPAPVVIPETPAGTKTFSPTMYPVRVAFAVQSLIFAVLGALSALHVWSLTEDQTTAVLAVYAALLPLIGSTVGSKVTPVAKLEAQQPAAVEVR